MSANDTSRDISTDLIDMTDTNDTIDIEHTLKQFIATTESTTTDFKRLIQQCRTVSKQLLSSTTLSIQLLCTLLDTYICSDNTTLPHKFAYFELLNHCILNSKRLADPTYYNELVTYTELHAYKFVLQLLPGTLQAQQYIDSIRKIIRMWQEKQYIKKYVLLNILKYIDTWKPPVTITTDTTPSQPTDTIQSTSPKRKRSKLHSSNSKPTEYNLAKPERIQHQPTAEEIAANKFIEDIRAEQKQLQYQSRLRPLNESMYNECTDIWHDIEQQKLIDHRTFLKWFTDTTEWRVDPSLEPQQPTTDIQSSPSIYTPSSPLIDDTSPAKKQQHEMLKAPAHSPSLLKQ